MALAPENTNEGSARLADYLILESRERGELLTPLKLQKLMFYADAWCMALFDEELTNEKFQAWVHGPVAPSQFQRFRQFQWRPITSDISAPDYSENHKIFLNEIIDVFGSESATALEIMTHQEPPWREARGDIPDDEPCTNEISKTTTKEFYSSIAKED